MLLWELAQACNSFLFEVRSNWMHHEGRARLGGKKTFLVVGVDVRHVRQKYGMGVSLQVLRMLLQHYGDPWEATAMYALHIVHLVHVDFPYDEVAEGERDCV